jgi:hypothetical protein
MRACSSDHARGVPSDKRTRKRVPARPLKQKHILHSTVSANRGMLPSKRPITTILYIATITLDVVHVHFPCADVHTASPTNPIKRPCTPSAPERLSASHKPSGRKSQMARFRVKACVAWARCWCLYPGRPAVRRGGGFLASFGGGCSSFRFPRNKGVCSQPYYYTTTTTLTAAMCATAACGFKRASGSR